MKRKCKLYYIYMKILNQIFDKKAAGNSGGSVLLLNSAAWLSAAVLFKESFNFKFAEVIQCITQALMIPVPPCECLQTLNNTV